MSCVCCGGQRWLLLGQLGNKIHLRCRKCGMIKKMTEKGLLRMSKKELCIIALDLYSEIEREKQEREMRSRICKIIGFTPIEERRN